MMAQELWWMKLIAFRARPIYGIDAMRPRTKVDNIHLNHEGARPSTGAESACVFGMGYIILPHNPPHLHEHA